MTDYLWPPNIIPASQEWRIVDNAGVFQSPLSGTVRTVSRSGARMGCTITIPPVKGQDRARIKSVLGGLRGRSNRIWIPDFSTTQRGSFSAPELLTNNDFSNGTTGWTATRCALTAPDNVLRARNTKTAGADNFAVSQTGLTVTQYAPYALRSFISALSKPGMSNGTNFDSSNYATDRAGLVIQSNVQNAATTGAVYPGVFDSSGNVSAAGDYAELSWTSLARCGIADAGPNLLPYSDQFDNAAWSKTNTTVSANDGGTADPLGTNTEDNIVETTATGAHGVSQSVSVSSAAADYNFCVALKSNGRGWGQLTLDDGTHTGYAYVNLTTGALGTVSTTGANIANVRAYASSLGNGWWYVALGCRKTSSSTTINVGIYSATADVSNSYAGNASFGMYNWRATFAQSSVPVRLSLTTTTATTGTAQTGSGIYLKGLPASTAGLLKAGDYFQIGNQINFAIASLDTDASGRGYLQCALPWRVAVADNDPLLVNTPMAKMILVTDDINWDTGPGQFSGFQLEFIEDVA